MINEWLLFMFDYDRKVNHNEKSMTTEYRIDTQRAFT